MGAAGWSPDSHEDAAAAALRETEEEAEIRPADVVVRAERVTSRMPGTVWHRPGLDMRHAALMLSRLRPDQKHTEVEDDRGVEDDRVTAPVSRPPTGAAAPGAGAATPGAARRRPGIPPLVQVSGDPVEWTYTTVVADAPRPLATVPNNESPSCGGCLRPGRRPALHARLRRRVGRRAADLSR